jgi:4-hydroxy-3-polyprenylbenzoate decarboxylase
MPSETESSFATAGNLEAAPPGCRRPDQVSFSSPMKLVFGATGASGAIYLQRLLEQIDCAAHEIHLVMSAHARQVAQEELGSLKIPKAIAQHAENDLDVPFVSGSARFDAMVIVPCSMATLGRIASGSSDTALLRAADVFLKERRQLVLVPRETPWNLIHARNVVTLLEAGAVVLPAIPSFYSRPTSLIDVVDTVVWRVLDQIGLPNPRAYRWAVTGQIHGGKQRGVAKTPRKKS